MRAVPHRSFSAAHVVQDEGDIRDTPAKVRNEQIHNIVVRRDRGVKCPARALEKTDKSFETMHSEGDAAHAFRSAGDGVFCKHAAYGTAASGNEAQIFEGDLTAVFLAAPQEQI